MVDLDTIPEAVFKYYSALGSEALGHLLGVHVSEEALGVFRRFRIATYYGTLEEHEKLLKFLKRNGCKITGDFKYNYTSPKQPISIWFKLP